MDLLLPVFAFSMGEVVGWIKSAWCECRYLKTERHRLALAQGPFCYESCE